jgi:uroporphyrinogen-III synthase
MRVLVTRPQHDALETADILTARGHQPLVAPLLSVTYRDGPALDLSGVQAILATSANGIRALARRIGRRDVPVFAVGPRTAHAASEAGFHHVKNADGDATILAKAVPGWIAAGVGTLLYASGSEGDAALAKELSAVGFRIRTENLYDVAAVERLPAVAHDALSNAGLDAVLLYSPRSARIFTDLVVRAGLGDAASNLTGICISRAAAANLAALNMRDIRVAQRPNQLSLLHCLDR